MPNIAGSQTFLLWPDKCLLATGDAKGQCEELKWSG